MLSRSLGARVVTGLGVQMPDVDVHCCPTDDFTFERRVRRLAHRHDNATIDEVEAVLRTEYPAARLKLRPRLADVVINERVTWYAFRDGRRH